jgi:hypothetical protein
MLKESKSLRKRREVREGWLSMSTSWSRLQLSSSAYRRDALGAVLRYLTKLCEVGSLRSIETDLPPGLAGRGDEGSQRPWIDKHFAGAVQASLLFYDVSLVIHAIILFRYNPHC